jgi:hypothetical protein
MGIGLVLGPDTSPYFVTPSLRHFITSYCPTALNFVSSQFTGVGSKRSGGVFRPSTIH